MWRRRAPSSSVQSSLQTFFKRMWGLNMFSSSCAAKNPTNQLQTCSSVWFRPAYSCKRPNGALLQPSPTKKVKVIQHNIHVFTTEDFDYIDVMCFIRISFYYHLFSSSSVADFYVFMLFVKLEELGHQQAAVGQDENIPDRSHFRLLA